MKKCWVLLVLAALLCGCSGAEETFETVHDAYVQSAAAVQREILVSLPDEAAVSAMENESGEKLYLCRGYTLTLQTMEAGDLNGTIQEISGYSRDSLTVMETAPGEFKRYDFVWSSAGENGDQLGRAAILDDGSHHYVLTCMAPESAAGELAQTWDAIFGSFWLSTG